MLLGLLIGAPSAPEMALIRRDVTDWRQAAVWDGGALRRELAFVRSGNAEIFVSVSAAQPRVRDVGLLVCSGWGHESTTTADLQYAIASLMAELGGVGVAFHYPGHGDSTGAIEDATFAALVRAAVDTVEHVSGTYRVRWISGGIRLGAAVAAQAAAAMDAAGIVLVEPALDPYEHLTALTRRSARAALGSGTAGVAFGVPVSEAVIEDARRCAPELATVLRSAGRPVLCVRYGDEALDLPDADDRRVSGRWRAAQGAHTALVEALRPALDDLTRGPD